MRAANLKIPWDRNLGLTLQNEDRSWLDDYAAFYYKWSHCRDCRLCHTRGQSAPGTGSLSPKVLVIGEAPGPVEDEQGIPFVGPTGTLLRETMKKVGFDLYNDVYFTNVVSCIPRDTRNSKFRAPTNTEATACLERLNYIVNTLCRDTKVVILLGAVAMLGWQRLMHPQTDLTILENQIRVGKSIGWSQDDNFKLYTTYHPSFIERHKKLSDAIKFKSLYQDWIYDFVVVKKFINEGVGRDNPRRQ